MSIDVGLTSGICGLWEQQTLFDYIIEVENQEIPVHKVVMASVSEYFRVMLNGSLLESATDRVKLQGQSAASISKLIELVYRGESSILKDNALDILGPAVYFQMMKIVEACIKKLQESLSVKNCLEMLSVFMKYSFNDEVEKVKKFLKSRCSAVLQHYKPEDTSYEVLQIIIDYWVKSEWDLFLLLKYWVNVDNVNRKVHLNALMSQIRFSLMSQGQVAAITGMEIFCNSEGPWCSLVRNAVKYHETPMHQKVLHTSVQAKARGVPMPVIFTTHKGNLDSFHALSETEHWPVWKDCTVLQAPTMTEVVNTIEINNFLIVCGGNNETQGWYIFNARTKTWSQMTGMHTAKAGFALIHHEERLYVLGGHTKGIKDYPELKSFTTDVEQYNLATDTWHTVNKMPTPVTNHAACIYGDLVYVSGGWREKDGTYLCRGTLDVECLDLRTGTWEKRAPMLRHMKGHKMYTVIFLKRKVILAIDKHFQMEYYQPASNQWTTFEPDFNPPLSDELAWGNETLMLAKGSVLYLINVLRPDEDDSDEYFNFGYCEDEMYDYEPDFEPREQSPTCLKWSISQNIDAVIQKDFSDLTLGALPNNFDSNKHMFGALLSLTK